MRMTIRTNSISSCFYTCSHFHVRGKSSQTLHVYKLQLISFENMYLPFTEFKKHNFFLVSELLQRVILFSGSGLSSWALQREPLTVKRKVDNLMYTFLYLYIDVWKNFFVISKLSRKKYGSAKTYSRIGKSQHSLPLSYLYKNEWYLLHETFSYINFLLFPH